MKKTYMQPEVHLAKMETTNFCAGSGPTWHVDSNGDHSHNEDETPSSDEWGWIISDKGSGNNGSYDPWDSDNW